MANKSRCAYCDDEMPIGLEVFDVVIDCEEVRFCSEECLKAAGVGENIEVTKTEVNVDDLDEYGDVLRDYRKKCAADEAYLNEEYNRSR